LVVGIAAGDGKTHFLSVLSGHASQSAMTRLVIGDEVA